MRLGYADPKECRIWRRRQRRRRRRGLETTGEPKAQERPGQTLLCSFRGPQRMLPATSGFKLGRAAVEVGSIDSASGGI